MAIVGEFGEALRQLDPDREPDIIVFYGEQFRLADSVGIMPLMKFAHVAAAGIDSSELAGLDAIYTWLQDCLDEGEWPRFEAHAIRSKAPDDVLVAVAMKASEVISGRPTVSPSVSSDGQSATSPSSSTPATRRASLGLVPVEQAMGLAG